MSNNINALSLKMELVWWAFTAILLIAILLPIYNTIEHYPFWKSNALFIIVFITFTRYVFLLRYTFLAKRQKLKVVLVFLSIPIIFYLISQVFYFQSFLDEQGVESFLGGDMSLIKRNRMAQFVRTEMLIFGVGSVFIAIMLPFRLLMSVWLLRNRGRV